MTRVIRIAALAALLAALPVAASAVPPGAEAPEDCAEGGVSGIAPADSLPAAADGVTLARVNEVAARLICICGCGNMVLDDCECGEAAADKRKIRGLLAEGKGPDEVVAAFVAADGELRLAAPTKEGFNLVVWVAPFVALVLGGTFLGWVLRSWTRRRPPAAPRATPAVSPEDAAYRARLDEELRRGA